MEQKNFSVTHPTKEEWRENCIRLSSRLQMMEAFFEVYPTVKDEFMTWAEEIDDAGEGVEMLDAQEVHAVREYFAMKE